MNTSSWSLGVNISNRGLWEWHIHKYRWITWHILPWELEGITSPYCLLIGQYPHHMTLCPPVATVKRCYEIRLYVATYNSIVKAKYWNVPGISYSGPQTQPARKGLGEKPCMEALECYRWC